MFPPLLLVDDDRLFREVVSDILSRRGYQVVAVDSGEEALSRMESAEFGVVVTDWMMPGLDGLSLLSHIRQRYPEQEVILLSQKQEVEAAARALRAGVTAYLQKPVDEADLTFTVERCFERWMLRRERARLINENLELSVGQSMHQRCLEFLSNPDLEGLQEKILSEFTAHSGAQSAAIWLTNDLHELVLKGYRGLVEKRFLKERVEPHGPLALQLRESGPFVSGEESAPLLYVPLSAGGDLVGFAQLGDPIGSQFKSDQIRNLRTLADFAAVAIKNARKLVALQKSRLRDRDTSAYNLSYFTDYASKEIYKARRYNRNFSLLTFSIDNLPQLRLRQGEELAVKATRAVIRAVSHLVRDSDVIAKASDQEFYLLLPETDFFGAMVFVRRVLNAVSDASQIRQIEELVPLALVGGESTFPKDGGELDELVFQCRKRMDERRVSLQRRLLLDGIDFWTEVEILLGNPESPRLPSDERTEPSRRGKVSPLLFEEIQLEVAREMLRAPSSRGVLYLGVPEIHPHLPLVEALGDCPADLASKIYLLGRRAGFDSHPLLTPVFMEGDARIARYEFLLWLSENSAYAFIQKRGAGTAWGFHTSDYSVVDGLIARLQTEYDLQPYY